MTLIGNVALGFALFMLAYPRIPNLPRVRAAIMRSNHNPIGPFYALIFVLVPRWLRLLLAAIALWNLLTFTLVVVIGQGGLDWLGSERWLQYALAGASCFAMAEISVLIALTSDDPEFLIPRMVRLISPWAADALPLAVMLFAVLTLNPSLTEFLQPWVGRVLLLAAILVALPIGAVLFFRWITPIPVQRPA